MGPGMSKSISPSKLVIGITVVCALVFTAIQIPDSRPLIGLLVFFGFFSFLEWLEK